MRWSPPVSAGERVPPGSRMTHAWLFTGPPGSGRSTAARAFAAALQCTSPDRALGGAPGCGFCDGCHTSLVGTHADVEVVRTDLLSIGVKETRELVRRAQLSPAVRPLAGDHPGGRRPAHGGRGQRAAEGGRGARAPHGVAALRALPRGRAAHHPVPLPSSHAAHPAGRRRRRCTDPARRHRAGAAPRPPRAPRRGTSAGPAASPPTSGPAPAARPCSSCRCGSTTSAAA